MFHYGSALTVTAISRAVYFMLVSCYRDVYISQCAKSARSCSNQQCSPWVDDHIRRSAHCHASSQGRVLDVNLGIVEKFLINLAERARVRVGWGLV